MPEGLGASSTVTIRPFVMWPDQRLRTACEPVEAITPEIEAIWQDMVETMDAMPGVGLAAPQIGIMLQLAVVDATIDRSRRILLANPEVLAASDDIVTDQEGSPNLPGVVGQVPRPKAVTVRYMDASGTIARGEYEGLEARSVQHQIDHLKGRMYFDNLSKMKRDMLLRKARKAKS